MHLNFKRRIIRKILAFYLAVFLAANPLAARLVWADEPEINPIEESTAQTVQQEAIEEPSESSQETTGEPAVEVATGDANSLVETDTIGNLNVDVLPGELETSADSCASPEIEVACPEDIEIANSNLATISGTALSLADTGDSSVASAAGDVRFDSGQATAGADIKNLANANLVILEDDEGGPLDGLPHRMSRREATKPVI